MTYPTIPTRKYSCYGTQYDPESLGPGQLEEFFERCRDSLEEHGAVRMLIEPNDGTSYEFLLTGLIEDGIVALSFLNDHIGFAVRLAHISFTVPSYVMEHGGMGSDNRYRINPRTAAVACDLVNRVRPCTVNDHWFYDWKTGLLIEGAQA